MVKYDKCRVGCAEILIRANFLNIGNQNVVEISHHHVPSLDQCLGMNVTCQLEKNSTFGRQAGVFPTQITCTGRKFQLSTRKQSCYLPLVISASQFNLKLDCISLQSDPS